jgi:phospholipid/cholesterol/gamma-HCH transport system substrate-binding protein
MSQAVKVGIFMTAALALLAWLIFRVEDWSPASAQGRRVDALFESVEGLDDKAAVRVAGVRVGRVDGIRLEGQRARVTLLLTEDVELTVGAQARIASLGLLGDKFLQLDPGPDGGPPLPPGATLPGETPVTFDQALAKLDRIGDSVEQLLGGGGGAEGAGFGPLVDSLRATADELRAVIAENRQSFGGTMRKPCATSSASAPPWPRTCPA